MRTPGPAVDAAPGPVVAGGVGTDRVGVVPARWGFGAYLLAEAVFLSASALLVLPYMGRGADVRPPPVVLVLGLVVPTVLAATVALSATWLRGNGPSIDLGLRFDRTDLLRGLAFGGAGILLTVPAATVWAWVVGPDHASSAVADVFTKQPFPLPLALAVFLVVWLVAPVCEEIVYRGLLWGAACRHGASPRIAFGLTTLLFALAHFEVTRTPLLLVIAVPIGLARLVTDRLGASIVAHQVNNLLPAASLLMVQLGVLH
jgi:hypothetical protein